MTKFVQLEGSFNLNETEVRSVVRFAYYRKARSLELTDSKFFISMLKYFQTVTNIKNMHVVCIKNENIKLEIIITECALQ